MANLKGDGGELLMLLPVTNKQLLHCNLTLIACWQICPTGSLLQLSKQKTTRRWFWCFLV